jgi:hypothetical protein
MSGVDLEHSQPKGFAFDIPDLQMLQRWADAQEMRMVVELDHCVEGEEYEEVLAFYEEGSALRQWTMWRASEHFVLEPMNGPAWRFARLPDLIAELLALRS